MADRTCTIDDCSKRQHARGLCQAHYFRWYRKGHTDREYQPGHLTTTSHGYRTVHLPDHPLADSRGHVYNHRAVLYDSLGPGPHECHWCHTLVGWDRRPRLLEVDHVDGDKGNDALDNLVPSCGPCNRTRARWPAWFEHNVAAGPAPR